MATIVVKRRYSQIREKGSKGIREALLSSPATGSNKITLKEIVLEPEGKTAKKSFPNPVIYFILSGKIALMHSGSDIDFLQQSTSITVQKNEYHYLHNTSDIKALVLMVASQ